MNARGSFATFVALLLVLGCARGLNDRAALPPPLSPFTVSPDAPLRARRPTLTAPDQLVHPPQIQRATLGNGMEIIWVERPDVPLVSLSLVVKTAGRDRSSSKPALADLTAVGLQFGTRFEDGSVPSRLQVDRTVPNPSVSNVHAGFSLTVLAGAFPAALELLALTVRAPAFTRLGTEAARLSLLESYADTTVGQRRGCSGSPRALDTGVGPPPIS